MIILSHRGVNKRKKVEKKARVPFDMNTVLSYAIFIPCHNIRYAVLIRFRFSILHICFALTCLEVQLLLNIFADILALISKQEKLQEKSELTLRNFKQLYHNGSALALPQL